MAIFLGLLLLGFAAMIIRHEDAYAGGADSSGYLNHARLLADGRVHAAIRPLPGIDASRYSDFLYSPLGFVPSGATELVPTYPAGLPLQIAAMHRVIGWPHAADAVMILSAVAGILLTYLLGRALGLGWRGAGLAAGALGASPLYLMFSVQTMSDVPALTWTAATAVAAWHARRRPAWALAAGACFGMAVLVRPNNALMLLPLAVAWWPERGTWKHTAARVLGFGLAGLPFAGFFFLHSRAAYGSMVTTGYGDAWRLFQAAVIPETLRHYAQWLPVVFTPGIWLIVLLPFTGRGHVRPVAFLGGWILTYLAFYVSYYHTHEAWWYLRFVLPAGPAFVIAPVWVLRTIWQRAVGARGDPPWRRSVAVAIVAGAALLVEVPHDLEWAVLHAGHGESDYPVALDWLNRHAPENSVLVSVQTSGAAFYYTPFVVLRFDQIDSAHFPEIARAAAAQDRPIYAPLFDFEFEEALKQRMPGLWQKLYSFKEITIYRWEGDGRR